MDKICLNLHLHYSHLYINYPSKGGWGKKSKNAPAIIGTETTTNSTNTDSSNSSNSTNSGIKAKAECVF